MGEYRPTPPRAEHFPAHWTGPIRRASGRHPLAELAADEAPYRPRAAAHAREGGDVNADAVSLIAEECRPPDTSASVRPGRGFDAGEQHSLAHLARWYRAMGSRLVVLGVVALSLALFWTPTAVAPLGSIFVVASILFLALMLIDPRPVIWSILGSTQLIAGGCLLGVSLLADPLILPIMLALCFILLGLLWGGLVIAARPTNSRLGYARGLISMVLGLLIVARLPLVEDRMLCLAIAAELLVSAVTLFTLGHGATRVNTLSR